MEDIDQLIEKVNKLKKGDKLDLSSDEDLSIALMNLVAIEEHLYFSGMKTDKKVYLKLLNSVRETRKKLLREILREPEGEVWCISKHLLAASMRLIEVGTKHLTKREEERAYDKFQDAFYLYSLFWSLNLKLMKNKELIRKVEKSQDEGWRNKITAVAKKIIDCCKE
jgi:hypothetical protein